MSHTTNVQTHFSRSAACIILDIFELQRQNQTKDRCTDLQIITWSKIQKIGVDWYFNHSVSGD